MKASIMTLVFFVFSIFMVAYSLTFSTDARFGPLVIGLPLVVLLVAQIIIESLGKKTTSQKVQALDESPKSFKESFRTFSEITGTLVGLVVIVFVFGIELGFAIFIIVYLKLRGEKWLTTVALGLGVPAFIYGVFDIGLKMPLYRGILWPLLFQ